MGYMKLNLKIQKPQKPDSSPKYLNILIKNKTNNTDTNKK